MYLEAAIKRLQNYIESEHYAGFDPYDGLKSPLFKLPLFKSNKKIRFAFQQLVKRSPVNLRPLFGIKKGKNPVTLGLCIQAYSYLSVVYPDQKKAYLSKIEQLLSELETLSATGFSGHCWGYDFDWEARYASIPGYQPTVVATGIITNALFECWQITRNQRCAELIISASQFVLTDLKRTYLEDTFCFSYSPFDTQTVLNASMKGARILAQTYSITKNSELLDPAMKAVQYVVKHQQENGSFSYSDKREQIDNYHTGYVLDCIDAFQSCFEDDRFDKALKRGLDFYVTSFFTAEGIPKFYNTETFPIDCTAAGQSLLTLTRFGKIELAEKVATFMCKNMQDQTGFFYFRKFKNRTVKSSFMRWSNAWMFAGMSYVFHHQKLK